MAKDIWEGGRRVLDSAAPPTVGSLWAPHAQLSLDQLLDPHVESMVRKARW